MGFKAYCLLLATLLLATNSFNFCQVQTPQVKLFTTQNQLQQIPLNKYIRGYNLDFSSSKPTVVSVFQPYHVVEKTQVTIKSGYSIVNVDGTNPQTGQLGRQGILFAVGGQKSVAVGYGAFSSGVLPKVEGYNYYQLPYVSNCYSGLIYTENLDVVIDCQKMTANPEQMTDLVCLVNRSGQKPICKSISSITKTSKRKSLVLTLGTQKYLISATLTDHISSKFQNQTFINIYHIGQQSLQFNLIIDRRTLGLDALSITDIDIVLFEGVQYLMITDANSQLIAFRYTEDNQVQNVMTIKVPGVPRQFVQSAEGTWLIATQKYVWQCTYSTVSSTLNVLKKYELDPADNQVTDLQSSFLFISVRTFLGHLYTYDRKYTDLKYLLNLQQINQGTSVIVSPFYPRLFQINSTSMVSIAISSGTFFVSQVQQSTDVTITAISGLSTCTFNIHIQLIKNSANKIYEKQQLTSSYRLQSNQPTKFILSDYFGGSNLKYDVKQTADLKARVQHINKYSQKASYNQLKGDYLFSKIVEINANSYWLAVFTTELASFYKCAFDQNKMIVCTENVNQRVLANGLTFGSADGMLRSDGKAYISWTYVNKNPVVVKVFGSSKISQIYIGYNVRYTQVLVGQKYFVYVQKQLNRISFYNGLKLIIFDKTKFNIAQLEQMGGGFYPREISDSHNNPHIFHVKFPVAIVTISYTGGENIQILSYTKVSDTYVPDDLWSMVVGRQTLLLFTPDQASEYVVLADAKIQKLHKILLTKKAVFPIRYQLKTDTAYFECQDGTIQYIRLNQPALDSEYYTLNLKGLNGGSDWAVSGSWLVTNAGSSFYQYQQPALVITSVLSDNQMKKDLTFTITVSNQADKKDSQAKITAFNYPVKIQASSAQDNGLTLPEKGDDQIIPFPLDSYFTGSVASYNIICPYCLDGTLKLVSPIRQIKQNPDLNGFTAVIGLQDNSGAIVLLQNMIKIVDLNNSVVAQAQVQNVDQCTSLGISQGLLVVFCKGTSQQLVMFTVTNKSITPNKRYFIPADALIMKPSQIGIYRGDKFIYVLVHDVDLNNPIAKDSNIKIFQVGDTIISRGQIDSSIFGIANSQPINSMSISGSHVLVTIGIRGLGYLNLAKSLNKGIFINLQNEPALANYTLDDTSYLRVSISGITTQSISALVTTSNSYSYVMELKVAGDTISFSKILQTYKRYGHQKSLNWGLIDDKFVMLSFYNKTSSTQTLALYKRSTKDFADFFATVKFTLPLQALRAPKSVLLHYKTISDTSSFFFLNNPDKPSSLGGLTLYNVTQQYGLLATYQKPSSFDFINVTAYNDYYSVSRDLKVEFDGQSGGVKWYAVVIVAVLVAIAIGVALGFYLRMKRKKADSKKVSLFTENQEIDEQV